MQRQIINGLMALTTSLLIWKLPESWWGWFVFSCPAAR
jgi:hypothetical protein